MEGGIPLHVVQLLGHADARTTNQPWAVVSGCMGFIADPPPPAGLIFKIFKRFEPVDEEWGTSGFARIRM